MSVQEVTGALEGLKNMHHLEKGQSHTGTGVELFFPIQDDHEGDDILSCVLFFHQMQNRWSSLSPFPFLLCGRKADLMLHEKWAARCQQVLSKDLISKGGSVPGSPDSVPQHQSILSHKFKHVSQADDDLEVHMFYHCQHVCSSFSGYE